MKNMAASLLVLMAACFAGPAGAMQVQSEGDANTPVTRAVMLLRGLVMKAEMQQKMEEKLFDKFVCWAKTIINDKTASNAAAEARIDELETYIANIDAGRIDFTSERVDLEKAIEGLKGDIEAANTLRDEENKNFLAAEEEMTLANDALEKAIRVLDKATSNHTKGVFLEQRDEASQALSYASAQKEAAALQRAVKLGSEVLSAGDSVFLQRLLTGEVPKWDWKKLNRKATFKMSYKARSFKIQEVLRNMLSTFSENLQDARDKEGDAKDNFDKLMKSKNAELKAAQDALEKMEAESTARGMTKQESQDEVDNLKEQMKNDKNFIKQTETTLKEKTSQWKERKNLRAAEIQAMNEAIAVLHNDDARDLMRRSFKSQGYSFLQQGAKSNLRDAAAVLRKAGRATRSAAMLALAARVTKATPLTDNSPFAAVIGAINNMLSILKAEETTDLEQKELCEKNRMENTRSAIVEARKIDDVTETINKLRSEIEEAKAELEETKEQIAQNEKEFADATALRKEQQDEWTENNKDDQDALDTIVNAKDVLTKFYADNMLTPAMLQVPGEAPPPPPKTWDDMDSYAKQGEFGRKSILALLDNIIDDVTKDQAQAKAEEDTAQLEYGKYKTESRAQLAALEKAKNGLIKTIGGKEDDVVIQKKERSGSKTQLDGYMKTLADAEPGCDYITINYPVKLRNRQIEMDGLIKAKAILTGGSFDNGPDPNREVKPGDAFLQKTRK